MNIPIFLSYPKPCFGAQQQFMDRICAHLESRGFFPRTLGITDYDTDAPLKAVRRLMLESNGLVTVALRRTLIEKGAARHGTDIGGLHPLPFVQQWLTTPWAH